VACFDGEDGGGAGNESGICFCEAGDDVDDGGDAGASDDVGEGEEFFGVGDGEDVFAGCVGLFAEVVEDVFGSLDVD